MIFTETIAALNRGDKVRRHGWMPGAYMHAISLVENLPNDFLMCDVAHQKDCRRQWSPSLRDLNATDWEIHVPLEGEES
jgi:hypothetical protein